MTAGPVLAAVGGLLILVASVLGWQRVPGAERSAAPAATVLAGSALFHAKGCASCHTGPGTGAASVGPNLSDAPAWAGERRAGLTASEYLHESIRDPGVFISPAFRPNGPTTGMPTLSVSEAEADALVAYLLAR